MTLQLIVFGIFVLIVFIPAFVLMSFGATWLRAHVSGARVSFQELIALSLRRIPVRKTVDVRIVLIKSGFNVSVDDLSTHHLAVGDVHMVAAGMIKAKEKKYRFKF